MRQPPTLRRSHRLLALLTLASIVGSVAAQQQPAQVDYEDRVEVRLVQVEVTVWPDSSQVPAARMSNSLLNIRAPVGHTPMQLPQ